jgi:hypothetical protein
MRPEAAANTKVTKETAMSDDIYYMRALKIVTTEFTFLMPMTEDLSVNGTLELGDLDRVHVPLGGSTTWQVPGINGTESVSELDGIILAHHDQRAFWRGSPEEGAPGAPPDCSSIDTVHGVGNPGGLCCDCPFGQYGSAGRGQACRLTRELAFIRPEDRFPFIVSVPRTSLKNVRKFQARLPMPYCLAYVRLGPSPVRQPGRIYSVIDPRLLGAMNPEYHEQLFKWHRRLMPR